MKTRDSKLSNRLWSRALLGIAALMIAQLVACGGQDGNQTGVGLNNRRATQGCLNCPLDSLPLASGIANYTGAFGNALVAQLALEFYTPTAGGTLPVNTNGGQPVYASGFLYVLASDPNACLPQGFYLVESYPEAPGVFLSQTATFTNLNLHAIDNDMGFDIQFRITQAATRYGSTSDISCEGIAYNSGMWAEVQVTGVLGFPCNNLQVPIYFNWDQSQVGICRGFF